MSSETWQGFKGKGISDYEIQEGVSKGYQCPHLMKNISVLEHIMRIGQNQLTFGSTWQIKETIGKCVIFCEMKEVSHVEGIWKYNDSNSDNRNNDYLKIYLSRTSISSQKLCIYIGDISRNHLGIHDQENKIRLGSCRPNISKKWNGDSQMNTNYA